MFFGSRRSLKSVTAAHVAALGAWMVFRAGDRVGGLAFNDAEIRKVRPHRSRSRIHALFGDIVEWNQSRADSAVQSAPSQLIERRKRLALAVHEHSS